MMSSCRSLLGFHSFFVAILLLGSGYAHALTYDVVLAGGRVMDPETGLDAVRNVGIRDGRIARVSADVLDGVETTDVSGYVVAPGFIDMHAHGHDAFSSRLQSQDGVTTALELEIGVTPLMPWIESKRGSSIINYGASASHVMARTAVLAGASGADTSMAISAVSAAAIWAEVALSDAKQAVLLSKLERDLAAGALGIGFGIQYTPSATRHEILEVFKLARAHDVICYTHTRYLGLLEPESSIAGMQEVIANAAATGAALHIVHVNSSSLSQLTNVLDMIVGARARGVDVTTEAYPYTAGSTGLDSAIFSQGWQDRLGVSFGDIEWPATGERLTQKRFDELRGNGETVIIHMMQEDFVSRAVSDPMVIIASDGMRFINGRAHPRGAGTFSRVLGRYVREQGALSLMDALRKMTIMPAERLGESVAAFQRKGRIQTGCDADIVVFDADRIIDRATFDEPAVPSAGIEHVIVNGTFVVRDGVHVPDTYPGRPILRTVSPLQTAS